jgi:SNF2 family DNA or RNA helicase
MERYTEMGYSPESAEEAMSRFGDDLHTGCHWLMTRETMGRVPKRLKVTHTKKETTYMGSTIRYLGLNWTVADFEPKHALIRIIKNDETRNQIRWAHISDASMEWIQIRHNKMSNSIPRASWHRKIGSVRVSFRNLERSKISKLTLNNALDCYIKYGRLAQEDPERLLWRWITSISRENVHEPARLKPRGYNNSDIHHYRIEWMSYFHALCDLYSLSQDHFNDLLYGDNRDSVLELFPEEIRNDLSAKICRWNLPQKYLSKQFNLWKKDCLPLILFRPVSIGSLPDVNVEFEVIIHDMTFIKPANYKPKIHLQMQRLFFHLFPATKPHKVLSGPVDGVFLNSVLTNSKKKHVLMTEPSTIFEGELFPYQKRCLNWLIHRETSNSTSAWGWSRHQLADGFVFYTSVFGHISLSNPNTTIHGGLLAQEVGMGKTIEMLSLIATNKTEHPTLIVLPTTMLDVWNFEAKKHVPSLTVVKFHGARRTSNMDDLRSADIVLTTYRVVVNETKQHIPTLGSIRWGRIILDESHEMKQIYSATSKAICRLFAPYRWCMSATPWPKGLSNVSSILAFLGVTPFDDQLDTIRIRGPQISSQLIMRHQREHNPSLICSLLSQLTWWQRKRHVRLALPPVKHQKIEIKNENADIYKKLLETIQFRIELDMKDSFANYRTRMIHYSRWLRQAATYLGLNRIADFAKPCLNHTVPSETKTIEHFIETLGNTNYDQSLKDIIHSWLQGNETCSICIDAMDRPTLTPCHHMFCYECIQSSYRHDPQRKCPLCRKPAENNVLQELKEKDEKEGETKSNIWRSTDLQGRAVEMPIEDYNKIIQARNKLGGKITTLINMIKKSDEKFIVFTQFHNAWKKLCAIFKENNLEFASIEGKMSPKQRHDSIQKFQTDTNTKIFIMTIKTASVGITLTAGSHIIFLEPCENVHIRKQAIGRAWRIGQTKEVTVSTLYTKDTIDMISQKDITNYLQPRRAVLTV